MIARLRNVSDHIALEVAAVFARGGEPLPERAPVPDCACWRCTGTMPAPRRAPDDGGIACPQCRRYRELVRDAGRAFYVCPECGTRSARSWPRTEAPDWSKLPRLAAAQSQPRRALPELPVEAARQRPILEVAAGLGLQLNRGGWCRCPFHDDCSPSFHVNAKKGAAFCNVCGKSWDPIALTMELRGVTFAEAVRELAA
jgi:hypothetical protein